MIASGLDDYERRVERATTALRAFSTELTNELDTVNGAFPWWHGYSDWKTLTLTGDYLIQSITGASEALLSASFAAKTHREATFAESHALTAAWRNLAKTGEKNPEAFIDAIPRDAQARRRSLVLTQSAEQCFFHLGQTLDRLAAALIIVGGFKQKDVATADWGTLVGTQAKPGILDEVLSSDPPHPTRSRVEPLATLGRTLQADLLSPITISDSYGVPDWLAWLRETRNAMTHRSPAKKLNLLIGTVSTGLRVAKILYRQPRWSEVQSLVFGVNVTGYPTGVSPIFSAFIMRPSEEILDGLCDATTSFVFALTDSMKSCWADRRANPALIVQHGIQWRSVEPTEPMSQFNGWGEDLSATFTGDKALMNPLDGRRWDAARLTDDRRSDWTR